MRDYQTRSITFPQYTDLICTLRSTVSGQILSHITRDDDYTLAEEVVDMILLHPVNFDYVMAAVNADDDLSNTSPTLVNLGPGNALWRSVPRSCPRISFSTVDWSAAARAQPYTPPSAGLSGARDKAVRREPIAIVGMAVRFPQADDIASLWKILENGINTVSKVPLHLQFHHE